MKIVKRVLFFLLILIIGIAAAVYFYLHSTLPTYNGNLKLKGLKKEVKVFFDNHAIPHIYASNEEDAYHALGYVHAQERLFQMEMGRKMASGRMAEILGSDLIDVDVFFRTIGIRHYAEISAARFMKQGDVQVVKSALAYIDGINEYIENGPTPIEYKILDIKKEKFDINDVFAIMGYTTLGFSNVLKQEPVVTRIMQKYGLDYLKDWDLDPSNSKDTLGQANQISLQSAFQNIREKSFFPVRFGSNGWVIGPKKTENGKVIFANDTHIFFAQPSTWFEAYIEYPGFKLYGDYLAGVPFGFIGHNPSIAWGLTIFPTDNMDMYFEKTNPKNPNQLWVNDHWEDAQNRDEVIHIKDMADTVLVVRTSRHGPIVDGLMTKDPYSDKTISLRWVYFEVPTQIINAIYQINRAKNIDQAREAAKLIDVLGLNVLYGDAVGNIAIWSCGKISKRPKHVNSKTILDGASGKDELLGYFDFSENPQIENPESGYIASANNRPPPVNGFNYPGYYTPDIRITRIRKLIESRDKLNVEDMKNMQRDVVSDSDNELAHSFAKSLVPFVNSPIQKEGVDYLMHWDGNYITESTPAVIYTKLQYYMLEFGLKDELGQQDFDALLNSYLFKRSIPDLFLNDSSLWWDDISTPDKESRQDILLKAYTQTMDDLQKQLGTNITEWKWGNVHTLTHVHPLGRRAPFDKVFNVGPFADPGTNAVLNKQAFPLNGQGEYHAFLGPALRIIHDFSQPDNSISINPTGQSGNFINSYYNDQAPLYNAGEYRKQMTNKNEVIVNAMGKLLLQPSIK